MLSLRECLSEAGGNCFFKSKTEKTVQRISKEHLKFELSPETGKHNLLWMIGEIGEVIDIVKKYGDIEPTNDVELRNHLVEEMADVLMHYNNVMLCYGISADELQQAYTAKFEKNMTRW